MIISIKNLKAKTLLGVHAHERTALREVVVNVELHYDATLAAKSDTIADALDYFTIEQMIVGHLARSKAYLLERLVAELLDLIMENTRVHEASVEIDKFGALQHAASVSVKDRRVR